MSETNPTVANNATVQPSAEAIPNHGKVSQATSNDKSVSQPSPEAMRAAEKLSDVFQVMEPHTGRDRNEMLHADDVDIALIIDRETGVKELREAVQQFFERLRREREVVSTFWDLRLFIDPESVPEIRALKKALHPPTKE